MDTKKRLLPAKSRNEPAKISIGQIRKKDYEDMIQIQGHLMCLKSVHIPLVDVVSEIVEYYKENHLIVRSNQK